MALSPLGLLLLFIPIAWALGMPYRVRLSKGVSMAPAMSSGVGLLFDRVRVAQLNVGVGDIVTFWSPAAKNMFQHRVVEYKGVVVTNDR